MAYTGVFKDIASPGSRSYVGTIARDKGTTGAISADQQVMRFFDRSENQPPLNPYHGRPVVDQTLGDQFGEARYELNVGLQIRNLVRADAEQPWFTIILPLRQSDELTITGTIWRYNRRLPTPTPYHAPSPYVTESFEEFYGQLQRYGESIRMESDFFHTPQGQQNFFLKLTGIASDMVEGIRFDVMRELLRAINQSKRYYHNHTYTENPMQDMMMRVKLFATLNKAPTKSAQLSIIAEKLERVLNEYVPGPYEMIVPPEWGIWMNKVNQTPVPQPYYLQGDDGGQLFIRNGPTPKGSIGRNNFWEYQDVTVETGSLPVRMLQRPVSVAEYYRALFVERTSDLYNMLTGLLASEKNVGRMRNIYVYSLTENKYIEVKIEEMIRASGIVPLSYNSNDPRSAEYRSLINEYSRLGTAARSKFYPDEKTHASGELNHANQRDAPMFLAWEPKGSTTGNYFIRVKYSGETDENVTGAEDHINQGQVLCAHLVKTYGLDRIGAHYANSYGIRRKLQMSPDTAQYWEDFYLANIYYSLNNIVVTGDSAEGEFEGSRLSAASDYTQIRERWGQQPYDNIGELATQPGGHYVIPNRDSRRHGTMSVPPGCDCAEGIRSISELSPASGWDPSLIEAVRDHEKALLSMVEMAKKLPGSELVNPLNRNPWEHSSNLGPFATAYTNGVSQFRAPVFLNAYDTLRVNGTIDFVVNFSEDDDAKGVIYNRDPLFRGGTAPTPRRGPTRAADPVTGSLGAEDDDDYDGIEMEAEKTILQKMLRDYFVNLQSAEKSIDTSYERAPTSNPAGNRGFMYTVTYFTNPAGDDSYDNSYIRAVFIGYDVLNTIDEDIAGDVVAITSLVIEEPADDAGVNDSHIVYIGTVQDLLGSLVGSGNQDIATSGNLLIPDESIGTVGARANKEFSRSGAIVLNTERNTVILENRAGESIAAGSGFYAEDQLKTITDDLAIHLEDYTRQTGPLGGEPNVLKSASNIPESFGAVPTITITDRASIATYPIRTALVMTPGMIQSKTYRQTGSIVRAGNKDTGYMTHLMNNDANFDRGGHARFESSPLVHGLNSIMNKIGGKAYVEWETSTPRHSSHFGFNQVNARMAGMDDEGMFPETSSSYARGGYYHDGDEDDEEEMDFRTPPARTRSRGYGMLGSRRRRGSSSSGNTISSYDDSEEGDAFGNIERSSAHIGARESRSYYEGARRRGGTKKGRFGRRPFAHDLERPYGARYSEAHARDFASDVTLPNGKLRKGYRMVRRFNGSNFVAKMSEVTSDPTSPCTFFSIASMMSRCDRIEDWIKLAKNKLHIAADFLLHRIVEVYAESSLLLKAGLGFTLLNNADYKNGEVTATKTYHGHLTVHYGAFVTQPDYELMMEDVRLVGYIGGKGSGMITSTTQLDTGGPRRGSARPSFICYAIPIAQKHLPQVLSLSGAMEFDDVLTQNMPVQGSLYGGRDWHNRRFRWADVYNAERSSRDYFSTGGYAFPQASYQGWQANYDLNEGLFKVYSEGEGHLSGGDYPGAINVVNGDEPYFDYPGPPSLF